MADNTKDFFADIEVEDSEQYRGREALGIREIALEQYRRCCVEGSKEMVYHTNTGIDQREVFVNAVEMLAILLFPFDEKYDDIKKEMKAHKESLDKVDGEYAKKYAQMKKDVATKKFNWNFERDDLKRQYELARVTLTRQKLVTLSKLLNKINYLGEKSV